LVSVDLSATRSISRALLTPASQPATSSNNIHATVLMAPYRDDCYMTSISRRDAITSSAAAA